MDVDKIHLLPIAAQHDPPTTQNRSRRPSIGFFVPNPPEPLSILIRVFAQLIGLQPHAWLMQLRARKAREMLQLGDAIADAVCLAGFADQSLLTRIFKRLMGYTPGQFSNSVQDA